MAWNEPGGNRNDQDPWGGGNRGNNQGPPDLDEALRKGLERLNRLFGGGGNGGGQGRSSPAQGGGSALAVIALVLVVVLGWNSVYTVDAREQAVVLRFGKFLETVGAGLQFKLPLVDDVIKVDVTSVRSQPTRGLMLTQDENIVEVNLTVQYVVNNARDYALAIRDAEQALAYATDAALRHEVGSSEADQVLTEGRVSLSVRVQDRLQRHLDFYQSGLAVSKVNIESTQPPREVQAAFQDVQRAKEDEQQVKEEAERYKNKVVPEARGKAQRMIEEASAYKQEVIAHAQGETVRFMKMLAVYEKAPKVTRERLYLDMMEKVMSRSSKVLVDVEGGNNMLYLPLDRMAEASGAAAPSAAREKSGTETFDINVLTDRVTEELRSRQTTNQSRGR